MRRPIHLRLRPVRTWLATSIVASQVAFGAGCGTSADASASRDVGPEAFYALDELPTFRITLSTDAVDRLGEKPRKFVQGTFQYKGVTLRDVGVRLKGHRSMRGLDEKAAFKLRFDKYDPGRRFLGQRRMTLNNMVEDPTMLREILAYRLMRAVGVPVPSAGYARLYVNDALYGLYLIVESLDDDFVARAFDDSSGNLYEGEYGCDLWPEDVPGFDQDAGRDETRLDLAELARAANGSTAELFREPVSPLAMDSFLAYLAVSAFVGDFDGYRHSHNYRIYHQPVLDKWFFVPWGLDRAFKKHLSIYDSQGLLAKRCFADHHCRVEYLHTMSRVVDAFERLRLDDGVRVVAAFIDEEVAADPRRPHTLQEVRRSRVALATFLRERPAKVRAQLSCLDGSEEVDRDGDGYGCMDCNDADPAVHPGAEESCDGVDNDCSGLADDAAACDCPAVEIGAATFYLCDLPMPWQQAAEHCASQGRALARIENPAQSRRLYRAAKERRDERWWIGLSDRQEEGAWQWLDGGVALDSDAAFWAKGEPDNDGCNQDCAALKQDAKGRWHDTHCGQHRPFICR